MKYDIIINKNNKIPKDLNFNIVEVASKYDLNKKFYLEEKTYKYFLKLKKDALKLGYDIEIESSFRTHDYQKKLFDNLVKEKGYEYAIKYVAKPYTSEHETGLAIDICIFKNNEYVIEHDLENLDEVKWLHKNAHKYGFILRYPKNKTDITGYNYEPWHFRYVGKKLAKHLYINNLTLEEYHINKS